MSNTNTNTNNQTFYNTRRKQRFASLFDFIHINNTNTVDEIELNNDINNHYITADLRSIITEKLMPEKPKHKTKRPITDEEEITGLSKIKTKLSLKVSIPGKKHTNNIVNTGNVEGVGVLGALKKSNNKEGKESIESPISNNKNNINNNNNNNNKISNKKLAINTKIKALVSKNKANINSNLLLKDFSSINPNQNTSNNSTNNSNNNNNNNSNNINPNTTNNNLLLNNNPTDYNNSNNSNNSSNTKMLIDSHMPIMTNNTNLNNTSDLNVNHSNFNLGSNFKNTNYNLLTNHLSTSNNNSSHNSLKSNTNKDNETKEFKNSSIFNNVNKKNTDYNYMDMMDSSPKLQFFNYNQMKELTPMKPVEQQYYNPNLTNFMSGNQFNNETPKTTVNFVYPQKVYVTNNNGCDGVNVNNTNNVSVNEERSNNISNIISNMNASKLASNLNAKNNNKSHNTNNNYIDKNKFRSPPKKLKIPTASHSPIRNTSTSNNNHPKIKLEENSSKLSNNTNHSKISMVAQSNKRNKNLGFYSWILNDKVEKVLGNSTEKKVENSNNDNKDHKENKNTHKNNVNTTNTSCKSIKTSNIEEEKSIAHNLSIRTDDTHTIATSEKSITPLLVINKNNNTSKINRRKININS